MKLTSSTVKARIAEFLAASTDCVYVHGEFASLGGERQVDRALRDLIADGSLVRVGYGVYARARKSSRSDKIVPDATLMQIGFMALMKLGVTADLGKEARANRDGLSTQVPMLPIISVGRSRVRGKIGYGRRTIVY